jgi:hypothetical protein
MKTLLILFFFTNFIFSQNIVEVSGQQFNKVITLNNQKLHFNGGGLRVKYWFDLYIVSLYLTEKSSDPSKIINSNEEAVFQMRIVSNKVTRDRFVETVKEGFERSSHGKASKEDINKFIRFFDEPIKKGDRIYLEYIPNIGIHVKQNGNLKGILEGLEFKKALFSLWLGNNVVDEDLKLKLLNK